MHGSREFNPSNRQFTNTVAQFLFDRDDLFMAQEPKTCYFLAMTGTEERVKSHEEQHWTTRPLHFQRQQTTCNYITVQLYAYISIYIYIIHTHLTATVDESVSLVLVEREQALQNSVVEIPMNPLV